RFEDMFPALLEVAEFQINVDSPAFTNLDVRAFSLSLSLRASVAHRALCSLQAVRSLLAGRTTYSLGALDAPGLPAEALCGLYGASFTIAMVYQSNDPDAACH